jgi:hypothetical protein
MRLLKLVGKVRQLQIIVMGLIRGLSSVSYILLLLLLIFYLYACIGVGAFRRNDPYEFGSLGVAMLTLFRHATLDSWSNSMYINWYGCDSMFYGVVGVSLIILLLCKNDLTHLWRAKYGDNELPLSCFQWYSGPEPFSTAYDDANGGGLGTMNLMQTTLAGNFPLNQCWHPKRQPVISCIYFMSFVLVAAYVMLSLFIGAVCGG